MEETAGPGCGGWRQPAAALCRCLRMRVASVGQGAGEMRRPVSGPRASWGCTSPNPPLRNVHRAGVVLRTGLLEGPLRTFRFTVSMMPI